MEQPMFSEEDFKILNESLDMFSVYQSHSQKRYTEFQDSPLTRLFGFGADSLQERLEKEKKQAEETAESITVLKAKLVAVKRWQRQQDVQSETTAQA